MSFIINIVYRLHLYFLIPIFILILIGKPRFLIRLIHKIMNIREPFNDIKIFECYCNACGLYSVFCFFIKYRIENTISKLDHNLNNMELYKNKIRELNLYERDGFMFLNFFILIHLIERLCKSHFKIWTREDKKVKIEKNKKKIEEAQFKICPEREKQMKIEEESKKGQ